MAHYAQIDENNIVLQVIVVSEDVIQSGAFGDPSKWIQTSYNTKGGYHYDSNGNIDNGVALRKNFAGIGYSYDITRDAFIPPKVYESWILNEDTCLWDPPVPYPKDGKMYDWDETTLSWK